MGNETGFLPWFASGAPAIWAGFFALAVWWIRGIPARKQQDTEARRSAADISDALAERLEARVKYLEARDEECHEELDDAKKRLAELEGYNLGQGRANQEAQLIVSAEREKNKGADQ